jgi:hypothetical protein
MIFRVSGVSPERLRAIRDQLSSPQAEGNIKLDKLKNDYVDPGEVILNDDLLEFHFTTRYFTPEIREELIAMAKSIRDGDVYISISSIMDWMVFRFRKQSNSDSITSTTAPFDDSANEVEININNL